MEYICDICGKIFKENWRQYGYKTLVVWEHELKNIVKVEERLREFNGA